MATIVLRYFPATGRAEPIRYALADAGVRYEDVRVSPSQWEEGRQRLDFGGPYRGLPTLTWESVTIGETLAISSFVAKRLGHYEALDDGEIARQESVVSNCYLEVLVRLGEMIWSGFVFPDADFGKSASLFVPRMVEKLSGVEGMFGGDWLCGKRPGMADFFAAEAFEVLGRALCDRRIAARFPRLS